jgi:asparagine synthase (glutamine-hydrolysing)
MCGIAGILSTDASDGDTCYVTEMIAMLAHRGPDGHGIHTEPGAALAHARLSVIDIDGGAQPMSNDDGSLWITFNGEIFNYRELRDDLIRRGHRFRTQSDTEVLLRLFEDRGPRAVEALNGQWAFAIWDSRSRTAFLSRDRLGVRPLFYTVARRRLLFASEIKALFVDPRVSREIDPDGLDDVFTFWSSLPPRTVFRNIRELPPGHSLTWKDGSHSVVRHWEPSFDRVDRDELSDDDAAAGLHETLARATKIRLRADVPVGAYVSGGLDSSLVAALAVGAHNAARPLRTFSIGFSNTEFDERRYQRHVAAQLATDHHELQCSAADIARVFPQVVWHAETPLLRTAPAPLYLLAQSVRAQGDKVMLTGEGADEVFGGYNIFKEAKLRRLWSQRRSSPRAALASRLYPYLPNLQKQPSAFLQAFFHAGPDDLAHPCFSHLPRWALTSRLTLLFSDAVRSSLDSRNAVDDIVAELPPAYSTWDPLAQAQYLEMRYFLPGYLLSSQGDRVAMAHGVETRFPYLDPDVVRFGTSLPEALLLRGLRDKVLLRRVAKPLMPAAIANREKQPYRAPGTSIFFDGPVPDYVEDLMTPSQIRRDGIFNPDAVDRLVRKCRAGRVVSVKDDMALVGVLSTQLLIHHFIRHFTTGTHGHQHPGTAAVHH